MAQDFCTALSDSCVFKDFCKNKIHCDHQCSHFGTAVEETGHVHLLSLWHWVFTLLTTWEPAAFFLTRPSQSLMNTHTHTHYWTAQSKNNEMLKNAAFVTGAHTACPTGFSPKSFNWIFLSVRGRRCSLSIPISLSKHLRQLFVFANTLWLWIF